MPCTVCKPRTHPGDLAACHRPCGGWPWFSHCCHRPHRHAVGRTAFAWCPRPPHTTGTRDVVSTAQLGQRMAYRRLACQSAGLGTAACGRGGSIYAYWLQHTWPLLALALAYASCVQWCARPALGGVTPLPQVVLGSRELSQIVSRCNALAGIAAVMVLMVALQPLHGFSPGLVSLLAMAAGLICVRENRIEHHVVLRGNRNHWLSRTEARPPRNRVEWKPG